MAKIKKDSQFGFDTVHDRLRKAGADSWYQIDLPQELQYFTFQRMHLVYLYGGSFVSTMPDISDERFNRHGIDNFMFLTLEFNPHAPVIPGAPGLAFTDGEPGRVYRIFTPWKGDHTWGYMGDYECISTPPLTVEEFKIQKPEVSSP